MPLFQDTDFVTMGPNIYDIYNIYNIYNVYSIYTTAV